MTPNLFVATQTLFSPHKWFKPSGKAPRSTRRTEHWDSPIPGIYEYIPGRGWYLIATDKVEAGPLSPTNEKSDVQVHEVETIKMTPPVAVKYSKVLKRYFLAPDYEMRKRHGKVPDPDTGKLVQAGFFQLDDGIAWVQCWDSHGEFIPGPYKIWCIDQFTGEFRHMLKGDDPEYIHSRTNSFDREPGARRRSTESRSTVYRSGPGSMRDAGSVPSSRANSIRNLNLSAPTSHPGSQPGSRRPSPKRSPSFPLAERLREVAAQQAASARTSSDTDRTRSRQTTPTRHATA